ncbi:MAG TPA: immunoglobulin domain-containing protein [Candidatus Didemnitutus sp.]|nr:immunoglobulin domain-containing protein [Candidatus Didemnitutus sp.]
MIFTRSPLPVVALLLVGVAIPHANAQFDIAFTSFAGAASSGSADGPGASARFYTPKGLFLDTDGSLVIADTGNATLRKLSADGTVSTIAGAAQQVGNLDGPLASARFNGPTDVARDSQGNLFVADTFTIRKITPQGTVSTFVGLPGASGKSLFTQTFHIAIDSTNRLFVTGWLTGGANDLVAFAPDATEFDYPLSSTYFPWGVAVDASDHLYATVKSYDPAVTPPAVGIFDASDVFVPLTSTSLSAPHLSVATGLGFASNGDIMVADEFQIRSVAPDGTITDLAGTFGNRGLLDGSGTAARFNAPEDLVVDSAGNIYVVEPANNAIRRITPAGDVTTVAGLYPASAGFVDGAGSAARFRTPMDLAAGPNGEVYVADINNSSVRVISPNGVVATRARLASPPQWLTVDSSGNVFATLLNSTVVKITPDGTVTNFAGASDGTITADGKSESWQPADLAFDHHGNLFVIDGSIGGIREISPLGTITTMTLSADYGSPLQAPTGLAIDANDNLFVVNHGQDDTQHRGHAFVAKITPLGVATLVAGNPLGLPIGSTIDGDFATTVPSHIAIDSTGAVYVPGMISVYRFAPDGNKAVVNLTVSDPGGHNYFDDIAGIAIDAAGTFYLADDDINANLIFRGTTAGHAPTFTTQPASQSVTAGQTAQFSAAVNALPAAAFQWYHNGSTISSGGGGLTLSLANVSTADAGDYTLVATNSWGQTTSAKATLTVTTTPATSSPGTSSGSGGGGALDSWFVAALLVLALAGLLPGAPRKA